MMSNKKQNEYLAYAMKNLVNAKKSNAELSKEWAKKFPNEPGVYVFFEKSELVYVGETKSIRERMKDMLHTQHHSLRRKVGALNFSDHKGYQKATSMKKFIPAIEKRVESWFINKMKLSFLPTRLGRIELEELIIKKFNPKYNSVSKRGYE